MLISADGDWISGVNRTTTWSTPSNDSAFPDLTLIIKNNIFIEETTFYTNPQFRISIEDPDSEDEDGNGTIVVGLMQKNRRKLQREGNDNLAIGYAVFAVSCF